MGGAPCSKPIAASVYCALAGSIRQSILLQLNFFRCAWSRQTDELMQAISMTLVPIN